MSSFIMKEERSCLESLLLPRGNDPKVVVHLAGLVSENEGDNGLAGHADVLEGAEDMDAGAGEDDSGFCGYFRRCQYFSPFSSILLK